jgi:hypothetical protein
VYYSRIIRALRFGGYITCLGYALFALVITIDDDGGANERNIPFLDIPLDIVSGTILWPVLLAAFKLNREPSGLVILLLFIATALFWGCIFELILMARRTMCRPRGISKP